MKKQHGGSRPGSGRPKSPYTNKAVKLPFIDEAEYREFLALTKSDPRLRVEIVLNALRELQ